MEPLHGVLHEARLESFCRRFGLRRGELEANFDGWHKRVILSPDSAFLFPRYEDDVAQIEREAAALRVLTDIALVPELRGVWTDEDIAPVPFLQTERRFGTSYSDIEDDLTLDEVGDVLERLGAATATWHTLGTGDLAAILREAPEAGRDDGLLDRVTMRDRLDEIFERLTSVLPREIAPSPSMVDVWESVLAPLAELPSVLTHGDIHETQLILDERHDLVAVLDWDHATVAHPTRDFNFGEWGFGIFAWEERFDELYRRYWDGYRACREQQLPDHRALLLLRTLTDARWAAEKLIAEPSSWFHALRIQRSMKHVQAVTASCEADRR